MPRISNTTVNVQEPRIFLDSLRRYEDSIRSGFDFLGQAAKLSPSDRIAIKPNLTFPVFRQGVMTNPEAIEAMVIFLKNFTDKITICESDSGGYNPFSMDEVFERTGIGSMAARYGVKVVNMTHAPSRLISFPKGLRSISVPLPTLLLDETDLFITMPVPKVHANTVISAALKNQWGIIQKPDLRLKLHPYFKDVIYQINKALPRTIVVVDGKYGLTRSGPMRGDVLELNWILVGNNIFYVDLAVSKLMGIDYRTIPYLKHILHKEGISSLAEVTFNTECERFISNDFYLQREWTDYPGVLTFNVRTLAYVGYESVLAKPLHRLLYKFREPFY